MKAKEQLKSLTPYKPGKNIEDVKKELGLEKIVKLASNENPFGSSEKAVAAIEKELKQFSIYPDGYSAELRGKMADFLSANEDQIIFGAGSDEVITMICKTYLTPDTNTIVPTPSFPQYKHNAVIEGAEIREISLKDGRHDFQGMVEAVDENTRIIWLCMVNNPTGEYIREDELDYVLKNVPSDVVIVCDEAYYEYVDAANYPNTLSYLDQYPNLVITRTFSKAYGLAALRIGYGIGHPPVIQALEPTRQPFNTSRIAQTAAIAAIDDQAFIKNSFEKNRSGLEQFYQLCNEFNLSYYPSQGNFILIDFDRNGDEVYHHLLKQGYIVRSGVALGFPNAVRITVGSREQNEEIINYLSTWLRQEARMKT